MRLWTIIATALYSVLFAFTFGIVVPVSMWLTVTDEPASWLLGAALAGLIGSFAPAVYNMNRRNT